MLSSSFLPEDHHSLPDQPGVYKYYNIEQELIYVGKAKSLKKRVSSYFNNAIGINLKTRRMVKEIVKIEIILVNSELDALLLENNLIKKAQPKYNILLRDDKTYPYLKLTKENYPRVYVTRRLRKDGATYFGPYFPGNLAHRLRRPLRRRLGARVERRRDVVVVRGDVHKVPHRLGRREAAATKDSGLGLLRGRRVVPLR